MAFTLHHDNGIFLYLFMPANSPEATAGRSLGMEEVDDIEHKGKEINRQGGSGVEREALQHVLSMLTPF